MAPTVVSAAKGKGKSKGRDLDEKGGAEHIIACSCVSLSGVGVRFSPYASVIF